MAILTATQPVDMTYAGGYWWSSIAPSSKTATNITFSYGYKSASITGTGFTFGPTFGGTITGFTDGNATVTGMNTTLAAYVATMPNGPTTQQTFHASQGVLFAGNDTATGSSGNDVIFTYGGNDVINGGLGNDVLNGGAGNDTVNGGAGFDLADYSTATAAVKVNLAVATAQVVGGGAGSDTLTAIEGVQGGNFNDILTGNAAANLLDGGAGNDILQGGAGNDILQGGLGNDSLYGGAGADGLDGGAGGDTYVYKATSDSTTAAMDIILQFGGNGVGIDRIDLSAIDANTTVAGNNAFTYLGISDTFSGAGQLRMGTDGIIYANVDANVATAEMAIDPNWGAGSLIPATSFIL